MRKIEKIVVLALITVILSFSSMAYAESKSWIWAWPESHWENLDFVPYLEGPKHPHNSQWNENGFKPEHWIEQRESDAQLVRGFYSADILRDQYVEDDIPVLEVGPAFYMLGGEDKRRVVATIDHVYGITEAKENGMFMLYDWKTCEAIGAYTRHGLQLQ